MPILKRRPPPKPVANVCRPQTYLPCIGRSDAPVMLVVDPVVDDSGTVTVPFRKEQRQYIAERLKAAGFMLSEIVVVSAAPPVGMAFARASNKPWNDYLKQHRAEIVRLIDTVRPRLVIPVGAKAAQQVFGRAVKIMQARGMPVIDEVHRCVVLPMQSLAQVMSYMDKEPTFLTDLQTAARIKDHDYKLTAVYAEDDQDWQWCLDLAPLIADFKRRGIRRLCVDCETTTHGNDSFPFWYSEHTAVLTVQVCWEPGKAVAVPIDYAMAPGYSRLRMRNRLVRQLKGLLEDPWFEIVGHNYKYDFMVLREKLGITTANYRDDTILLAHAVNENLDNYGLDDLVRIYVPAMAGYNDVLNKDPEHVGKTRMDRLSPDKMLAYGCGDVDAGIRLSQCLDETLRRDRAAYRCYRRVTMPAMRAFCDVERVGFPVNVQALHEFEAELRREHKRHTLKLIMRIPRSIRDKWKDKHGLIKLTRPVILKDMLFAHEDGLRLTPRADKTTKGGEVSTDKKHLAYFKADYPFVRELLAWKERNTMLTTFIRGFYKHIRGGLIRPSYLLHRTVTGRSASESPNGQNFPKRGRLAKLWRRVFQAPQGWVLFEVDYSQIELRIVAIMANEQNMLRAYRNGKDIHTLTAMLVNGIRSEAQWEALDADRRAALRRSAKPINFGYIYGMWWKKFRDFAFTDYGVVFSDDEARENREGFFRAYPGLERWHRDTKAYAHEHGMVRSLDGRVRHLRNLCSKEKGLVQEAERMAVNSPVQAFASNLGLMALTRIQDDADPAFVRPLGFVHDALVGLVREDRAMEGLRYVKRMMESNPLVEWFGPQCDFSIPILADPACGKDLSEMIEVGEIVGDGDKAGWTWDDIRRWKHPAPAIVPQRPGSPRRRLRLMRKTAA